MISQKLKINDDKTEFLILASPNMHSKLIGHSFSLPVGHCSITPTSAARSLGVIFDDKLSMDAHIKSVCKSTQYHLRNIGAIRHLLTDDAAAQLVHSLISSRLDYCNSLLCGLPDNAIQKLQRIQNNAARIVSRCAKHEHISPILKNLHWLPVSKRILYKVMLLTFKALHDLAPSYLRDLVTPYEPTRSLRSSSKHLLVEPKVITKRYGQRAYMYQASHLWNTLPQHFRAETDLNAFMAGIKTFLFKL